MRKYRVRLMRTIIPGIWNVCIAAHTVEALDIVMARNLAPDLVNRAIEKSGLFITVERIIED